MRSGISLPVDSLIRCAILLGVPMLREDQAFVRVLMLELLKWQPVGHCLEGLLDTYGIWVSGLLDSSVHLFLYLKILFLCLICICRRCLRLFMSCALLVQILICLSWRVLITCLFVLLSWPLWSGIARSRREPLCPKHV